MNSSNLFLHCTADGTISLKYEKYILLKRSFHCYFLAKSFAIKMSLLGYFKKIKLNDFQIPASLHGVLFSLQNIIQTVLSHCHNSKLVKLCLAKTSCGIMVLGKIGLLLAQVS